MRYCGVLRVLREYCGVLWDSVGYSVVLWGSLGYCRAIAGVLWGSVGYCGVLQRIAGYCRENFHRWLNTFSNSVYSNIPGKFYTGPLLNFFSRNLTALILRSVSLIALLKQFHKN